MAQDKPIRTVAIVGAGLVGSGWATIFVAAGLDVQVFDAAPDTLAGVRDKVRANLAEMARYGLTCVSPDNADRMLLCSRLPDAVAGADYVQESVLETVELKRQTSAQIDAAMAPDTLVGSSSSGIPASSFTEALQHRGRFFVVHPVNPPHLVPLVELVPAPWSDHDQLPVLRRFMEQIGRTPIELTREVDGFILNRLQGALLNEAWALYAEGYASAADIDRTVSDGLGLRWAHMGPFETIDLNAPGGIADYARRLAGLYHGIARSRTDPKPWPDPAVARAAQEMAEQHGATDWSERLRIRDRKLAQLLALKSQS